MPPRTVAVIGAKGGTTKTATAAALGHLFAQAGWSTLLVDLDPQGSLTRRFGRDRAADPLSAELDDLDLGDLPAGQLRLMHGGRSLEGRSEEAIMAHLARPEAMGADVVVVDTPPALGPIVHAAFARADYILVPCVPGAESLDGFDDVQTAARVAGAGCAPRAVLSLTRPRTNVVRWTREAFTARLPGTLLEEVEIPHEVAAAEAAILRLPVTASAPESRSAAAYQRLAMVIAHALELRARMVA